MDLIQNNKVLPKQKTSHASFNDKIYFNKTIAPNLANMKKHHNISQHNFEIFNNYDLHYNERSNQEQDKVNRSHQDKVNKVQNGKKFFNKYSTCLENMIGRKTKHQSVTKLEDTNSRDSSCNSQLMRNKSVNGVFGRKTCDYSASAELRRNNVLLSQIQDKTHAIKNWLKP